MDSGYSPGRIQLLLWRYYDLVRLTSSSQTVDAETVQSKRLPKVHPEGGFEDGASVKADLDAALMALEPVVRRVVWDYYVAGYAAVEIAGMLKHAGVNRWFVDRARKRGVRQMALRLGWVPKKKPSQLSATSDPVPIEQYVELEDQPLRERMAMVVARSMQYCPAFGPPGYACPVLVCSGTFAWETGAHTGKRLMRV